MVCGWTDPRCTHKTHTNQDGALGTHFHIHAMPSLNHRFRVFRAPPHLAKACAAALVLEEDEEGEGDGGLGGS